MLLTHIHSACNSSSRPLQCSKRIQRQPCAAAAHSCKTCGLHHVTAAVTRCWCHILLASVQYTKASAAMHEQQQQRLHTPSINILQATPKGTRLANWVSLQQHRLPFFANPTPHNPSPHDSRLLLATPATASKRTCMYAGATTTPGTCIAGASLAFAAMQQHNKHSWAVRQLHSSNSLKIRSSTLHVAGHKHMQLVQQVAPQLYMQALRCTLTCTQGHTRIPACVLKCAYACLSGLEANAKQCSQQMH
jgi:hypothetical protein